MVEGVLRLFQGFQVAPAPAGGGPLGRFTLLLNLESCMLAKVDPATAEIAEVTCAGPRGAGTEGSTTSIPVRMNTVIRIYFS